MDLVPVIGGDYQHLGYREEPADIIESRDSASAPAGHHSGCWLEPHLAADHAEELIKEDLDHAETRQVLDLIMDETRALFDAGKPKEILTVDNHADGPYVWMRLLKEDPKRAEEVFQLLQFNEGNSSGRGIGCISWNGDVSADQFWRHHVFGNVLERPFSEIWDDPNIELLHKLKDKKPHVKGRCAKCRFLNICGGNFRSRAEAYYGDEWAEDPACYLTDEEIGIK